MKALIVVKKLIQEYVSSWTEFSWYGRVLSASLIVSVFVLALNIFFTSLVRYTHFRLIQVPEIETNIQDLNQEIISNYPENLVLNFKDSRLNSTETQFQIDWPQSIPQLVQSEVLLLADLNDESTEPNSEYNNKTFMFLTQDALYFSNLSGDWAEIPLPNVVDFLGLGPELSITHSSLSPTLDQVKQQLLSFMYSSQVLFFLVIAVLVTLEFVFLSLILGLISWVYLSLFRSKLHILKSIRFAAHLFSVSLVVFALQKLLMPNVASFSEIVVYWTLFPLIVVMNRSQLFK